MEKIAIFISDYGLKNRQYLIKQLEEFNSYKKYSIHIFLFYTDDLNIESYTNLTFTLLKYPLTIGERLTFEYRELLRDNLEKLIKLFDIFIAIENDILIKEKLVDVFYQHSFNIDTKQYAIGSLRFETCDNEKYLIDLSINQNHHLNNIININNINYYLVDKNPHSAMNIFTKDQIVDLFGRSFSKHFISLETSISEFYYSSSPICGWSCNNGIKKINPVEFFEYCLVHHLPNKYCKDKKFMDKYLIETYPFRKKEI